MAQVAPLLYQAAPHLAHVAPRVVQVAFICLFALHLSQVEPRLSEVAPHLVHRLHRVNVSVRLRRICLRFHRIFPRLKLTDSDCTTLVQVSPHLSVAMYLPSPVSLCGMVNAEKPHAIFRFDTEELETSERTDRQRL